MIYENQGSIDKALQYGLVAGLLDPKHYEDWCKLGEMSLQQRNLPQALICFNKGTHSELNKATSNRFIHHFNYFSKSQQ